MLISAWDNRLVSCMYMYYVEWGVRYIHTGLVHCFHSMLCYSHSMLHCAVPILFHCRVVWVFGNMVQGPIEEVTPTHLTMGVLATLRQADHLAHTVLRRHSKGIHHSLQIWTILVKDTLL